MTLHGLKDSGRSKSLLFRFLGEDDTVADVCKYGKPDSLESSTPIFHQKIGDPNIAP